MSNADQMGEMVSNGSLAELQALAAADGSIVEWPTRDKLDEGLRGAAVMCLADMHNDGRLDVVRHLNAAASDKWTPDFLTRTEVYERLIPLLNDKPERLVSLAISLAMGRFAPMVQEAFLSWCEHTAGRTDLPRIICRWLLTGGPALCIGIYPPLIESENQHFVFSADVGNESWSDARTLYLARKASVGSCRMPPRPHS